MRGPFTDGGRRETARHVAPNFQQAEATDRSLAAYSLATEHESKGS